jgi:hypothetical protein
VKICPTPNVESEKGGSLNVRKAVNYIILSLKLFPVKDLGVAAPSLKRI